MAHAVDLLQLLDDPYFDCPGVTVKKHMWIGTSPESLLLATLLFLRDLYSVLKLAAIGEVVVDGFSEVKKVDGDKAWLWIWWSITSEDARLDKLQRDYRIAEAALVLRLKLSIAEDLSKLRLDADEHLRASSGEVPLRREIHDLDSECRVPLRLSRLHKQGLSCLVLEGMGDVGRLGEGRADVSRAEV